MRSQEEMFDLILQVAKEDKNIRAVILNGSRANKNVSKDIFQDYDILYVVNSTSPYIKDENFILKFGKIMYMQMPEKSVYNDYDISQNFGWLCQFTDGNRLDLHVCSEEYAKEYQKVDSLFEVILDKDNIFSKIKPSEKSYYIKKPISKMYLETCNEFWWCLNNVAKGLYRKEEIYVLDMINFNIRPMLLRMLSWKIGFDNTFDINLGKSYKYIFNYLDSQTKTKLLSTYSSADIKNIWEATFQMCELFGEIAPSIGEKIKTKYNKKEANNSLEFLKHIKDLKEDTNEIY